MFTVGRPVASKMLESLRDADALGRFTVGLNFPCEFGQFGEFDPIEIESVVYNGLGDLVVLFDEILGFLYIVLVANYGFDELRVSVSLDIIIVLV